MLCFASLVNVFVCWLFAMNLFTHTHTHIHYFMEITFSFSRFSLIFTLSVTIYSLAASNNDNTTYFFICHWINRKNLRPHFSICFHLKFIKIRFPDARLPVARILKMRAHCWERFWSKREKEKASVFQVRIIHLSNITITSPESKTSILTRMDIFNGVRTPWPN